MSTFLNPRNLLILLNEIVSQIDINKRWCGVKEECTYSGLVPYEVKSTILSLMNWASVVGSRPGP